MLETRGGGGGDENAVDLVGRAFANIEAPHTFGGLVEIHENVEGLLGRVPSPVESVVVRGGTGKASPVEVGTEVEPRLQDLGRRIFRHCAVESDLARESGELRVALEKLEERLRGAVDRLVPRAARRLVVVVRLLLDAVRSRPVQRRDGGVVPGAFIALRLRLLRFRRLFLSFLLPLLFLLAVLSIFLLPTHLLVLLLSRFPIFLAHFLILTLILAATKAAASDELHI